MNSYIKRSISALVLVCTLVAPIGLYAHPPKKTTSSSAGDFYNTSSDYAFLMAGLCFTCLLIFSGSQQKLPIELAKILGKKTVGIEAAGGICLGAYTGLAYLAHQAKLTKLKKFFTGTTLLLSGMGCLAAINYAGALPRNGIAHTEVPQIFTCGTLGSVALGCFFKSLSEYFTLSKKEN